MSVQRIFRCDGDECERNVKTQGKHPPTFVTVHDEPGFPHETRTTLHFCGWDCLLKHAATFEPAEEHEIDDLPPGFSGPGDS